MVQPALDLYYWPTPNGWKITILLEELGQPYNLIPVDIRKGAQFDPEFLGISPNNKIPALVDRMPGAGSAPVGIFESAAIMMYLADKYRMLWPENMAARYEVAQWLAWQISALGPTAGQVHHFREYAVEKNMYAIKRFTDEINRLYGVLDKQLANREYIAGSYSIADIACWVWVRLWRHHGQNIQEFPHLHRWLDALATRPAVNKGFRIGNELRGGKSSMTEESRKHLLNQRARS
nr:glutathione S-transferase N-terminal domain-containing protein [Bradyrhizobium sp. 33ap4]